MRLETIAHQYTHGRASMPTPMEADCFHQWLGLRFGAIAHQTRFTAYDVSPEAFLHHWQTTGTLLISTANSEHPFLTVADNKRFRAVHDWDHLCSGSRFDWEGEVSAYHAAAQFAPRPIKWMLRSEILGQAAVTLLTGAFPAQKLVRTVVG